MRWRICWSAPSCAAVSPCFPSLAAALSSSWPPPRSHRLPSHQLRSGTQAGLLLHSEAFAPANPPLLSLTCPHRLPLNAISPCRYVQSKERRMRAAFDAIDKDGDGQLSVAEVHRAAAGGCRSCPDRRLRGVGLCEACIACLLPHTLPCLPCCPCCPCCHAALLTRPASPPPCPCSPGHQCGPRGLAADGGAAGHRQGVHLCSVFPACPPACLPTQSAIHQRPHLLTCTSRQTVASPLLPLHAARWVGARAPKCPAGRVCGLCRVPAVCLSAAG